MPRKMRQKIALFEFVCQKYENECLGRQRI